MAHQAAFFAAFSAAFTSAGFVVTSNLKPEIPWKVVEPETLSLPQNEKLCEIYK